MAARRLVRWHGAGSRMRPPKQSSSQCLRDKASSALECATGKLGTNLSAFAPNHFVGGLFARQAQDKLVGHFKIMRSADAHTAVGSVDHETIVLWRARFGHDDREMPELATQRATLIRKGGPNHNVTNRLGEAPQVPFSLVNIYPLALARYLTRSFKFSLHFGKIACRRRILVVLLSKSPQRALNIGTTTEEWE